ncbi:ATP-binding cassette domain-containing protein [bacterium]|nr:MAG: ATP-binding cassette domain-containing protein [bacterium]
MFDLTPLWLRSIEIAPSTEAPTTQFPFNLPLISAGLQVKLECPVTFFAGENGAGKSTLLEALALSCALPTMGAREVEQDPTLSGVNRLANTMRLVWSRRARHGFFFRAEDFFGFQGRISTMKRELQEQIAGYEAEMGENVEANKAIQRAIGFIRGQIYELDARYGRDPDAKSHGEAFLSAFRSRISAPGLYLLDEPEAALSPLRQMAFLKLVKDAVEAGSQFIIATHSPLVLRMDGAQILDFDAAPPSKCEWEDLASVRLWSAFWSAPESFLRRL